MRLLTPLFAALIAVGCASGPATIQTGPDAEVTFDGLHRVDNSKADEAWARPDFDISGYTKIMPVRTGIRYRRATNEGRTSMDRSRGGPYFIDDNARAKFEALVSEVFREELAKVERYTFVTEPGPDVMILSAGLIDVWSNVPPDNIGGRSDVYLRTIGEATLVLELLDSETATVLARSVDRRAAENIGGSLQESNSVSNKSEVRRLIRFWATRLREGLDGFGQ